jgi:polyketide synthase PksN
VQTRTPGPRRARFARALAPSAPAAEPVAVIGMSGCFPKAPDIGAFWRNLLAERDCIGALPPERWDWQTLDGDPDWEATKANLKGGFIEGVDEFDPLFFGISPREAELMDPQQRLLMTYVWKAIEDAGYSAASLSGSRTAIMIGTAGSGYEMMVARAGVATEPYSATGTVSSVGPNRMSYFLNLHGPSEPIETACSSSLVAVHRAMQALAGESCEMAIAGGISILLSTGPFISFSKAGMLSRDGRCKTFSRHANGYVRGEGVGMLVLKKLAAAEADGDHIYGLIRASAENHGGRAQSLTAPNPAAQAELLTTAYRRAGIDPRTIGYIEAHGTGTRLGDPIEINGLKSAFAQLSPPGAPVGYCGLGSVKTNIGHLELAAGVAGIIKVMLQLEHKTLVKSLHCEELNPLIELDGSPFYVVTARQDWKAFTDGHGRALPRRAGVSSFGFGGANAHVVIEEYRAPARSCGDVNGQSPALVVLSAKNEERLKQRAGQLLDAIDTRPLGDGDLADVAYTLQVGREAMEARLGVIAPSMAALQQKLRAYLAGEETADLYRGLARREKDALVALAADEDMAGAIAAWVAKGKYGKLLDLWVKGLAFDWNALYQAERPRRISLPSYPFARERYWVPLGAAAPSGARAQPGAHALHPLLHANTSDLSAQRFSSRFDGGEFFLRDHVVKGARVLPGVAYLEMARAAVLAAAADEARGRALCLSNVVWTRPLIADGDREVAIELAAEEDGAIAFEIYSQAAQGESEPLRHSQGRALLAAPADAPMLDIAALRAACPDAGLSSEAFYQAFAARGLDYGPAHRAVEALFAGVDGAGQAQVLARIELPTSVADTQAQYVLHPSALDAAVQASAGLAGHRHGAGAVPALPFALEEVAIFAPSPARGWAWVREAGASKVDIDLCAQDGRVCVRLRGLTSRPAADARDIDRRAASDVLDDGTRLFSPAWQAQAVNGASAPAYALHRVVLCEPAAHEIAASIEAALPGVSCVALGGEADGIAGRFEAAATRLLELVQEAVRHKGEGASLIQIVTRLDGEEALFAGLSGLLKTARLEHPRLAAQVIEVEADEPAAGVVAKLRDNAAAPQDQQVRYRSGDRLVATWAELAEPTPAGVPWRDGGVYLITGGAGGLGLIFAREISERAKQPTLILAGRSQPSDAQQARLAALEGLGARVAYRRVDVADGAALAGLTAQIKQEFGGLHGIVHAAGVLRDGLILTKRAQDLRAVLSAKVAGLVNLDEATLDHPLEFIILFASSSGAMGNVGQADYAAANAFLDAYATYRNALVVAGQRRGRALALDWPLWRDGGMQVDAQLAQARGIVPLATASGLQAFYRAFASGHDQVLVVPAGARLPTLLPQQREATTASMPLAPAGAAGAGELIEKVQEALVATVSRLLKVRREDIALESQLSEYGFDSISLTQLANRLNESYGLALLPTIFFEYPTLGALADYLLKHHHAALAARLAAPAPSGAAPSVRERAPEQPAAGSAFLPIAPAGAAGTGALAEQVQGALVTTVSQLLKVRREDIALESQLSEYGFDSISLTQLANRLNESYGLSLLPTIFFEYPTLGGLADYLVEHHHVALAGRSAAPALSSATSSGAEPSGQSASAPERAPARRRARFVRAPAPAAAPEPAMVIGVSPAQDDQRAANDGALDLAALAALERFKRGELSEELLLQAIK